MSKIGKYTKHTRHISRGVNFVSNGENCKMHKFDWCEEGLQLANSTWHTRKTNARRSSWVKYHSHPSPLFGLNVGKPTDP